MSTAAKALEATPYYAEIDKALENFAGGPLTVDWRPELSGVANGFAADELSDFAPKADPDYPAAIRDIARGS